MVGTNSIRVSGFDGRFGSAFNCGDADSVDNGNVRLDHTAFYQAASGNEIYIARCLFVGIFHLVDNFFDFFVRSRNLAE